MASPIFPRFNGTLGRTQRSLNLNPLAPENISALQDKMAQKKRLEDIASDFDGGGSANLTNEITGLLKNDPFSRGGITFPESGGAYKNYVDTLNKVVKYKGKVDVPLQNVLASFFDRFNQTQERAKYLGTNFSGGFPGKTQGNFMSEAAPGLLELGGAPTSETLNAIARNFGINLDLKENRSIVGVLGPRGKSKQETKDSGKPASGGMSAIDIFNYISGGK